jgi:endonuclease G
LKQFKLLFFISILTCNLFGAATSCTNIYLNNQAPTIINTKLKSKTKELCYKGFALMYSGVSKTPLWSGEHLTREMLTKKGIRSNIFHTEERLSERERTEIMDYIGIHYDKGEMTPSLDFSDKVANHECFSLANTVPQNHNNNVGIWYEIEEATRAVAKNKIEIYVISGPIFYKEDYKRVNGIQVPTKLFKAIFVPSVGEGAVYVSKNANGKEYEVISIAELETILGINLFPTISQTAKMYIMDLPVLNDSKEKQTQWKSLSAH